jgi:site-specific DNA recombinase
MQVAAYARVSTLAQKKEATIDSQLHLLKEHVQQQDWSLLPTHVYADEGVSGARLDRPALDRLRDVARRGEIDAVLILSPDRLARHYAHQWLLIEEFRKCQVDVIFLENPYGDTPQGKLLVQMQGMIAEYERAAIAERSRRGRLEKARKGEFMPWAYRCYGYKYIAKRYGLPPQVVIDEVEADVVRRLFGWLVEEQMSLRQMAKRLNQQQAPTPSGKHPVWHPATIRRILMNTVYAGQARYNYRYYGSPKFRKSEAAKLEDRKTGTCYRAASEWVWSEAPAIISMALYEKAQLQLKRNAEVAQRAYQPKQRNYLLRTRVRCGLCGMKMIGVQHSCQRGQGAYSYYRCQGKDALTYGRAQRCASTRVRADRLDALVWSALSELLKKPSVIPILHQQWQQSQQMDLSQLSAQQESVRTRRQRLEGQIQKLVDAYQADVITLTELSSRRKKLEADVDRMRREESSLAQQEKECHRWDQVIANVTQFRKLIRTNLDRLDFQDRQVLAQCLIEKVVVTGEDVDIFYVLPFDETPEMLDNEREGKEPSGHVCRLRIQDQHCRQTSQSPARGSVPAVTCNLLWGERSDRT